jgi:hypothetical protein
MRLIVAVLALATLTAPAMAQRRAPAGAQNSSFNLVNRSQVVIKELFVTASGNTHWGQNRLDGKAGHPTSLAPGASFAVRRALDTNCIFDIRVVLADGRTEDRRGVNTCAVEDVAFGGPAAAGQVAATGKAADDPSIKLFNRSARPITEFRAVATGSTGGASPNRLGPSPLPPDNFRAITMPRDGNCIFDLRVVFADGKAVEKKKANLCRIAELPVP